MIISSHARSLSRLMLIACTAAVLLIAPWSSQAAQHVATESAVKAAYIYRFLEYVTWPAQTFQAPEQPIVIGTTENDEVTAELNRLVSDRYVQNRRLKVVSLGRVQRDTAVHVLYLPNVTGPRAASALEAARTRPILVITAEAEGLDRGATINFVENDGRIRFEVSLPAANRAGLIISARLLAVATRIKKGEYRTPTFASMERRFCRREPRGARWTQQGAPASCARPRSL